MFAHKRLLECFNDALKKNDVIEVNDDTRIVFFLVTYIAVTTV